MLHPNVVAAANTTAYARHKGNDDTWSTDVDEMYLFIAVHIRMGIVRLPTVHMYWAADTYDHNVVRTFTRHKFEQLLRFFHVAPVTSPNVPAHLRRLHPLLLCTRNAFKQHYLPIKMLTIDESMVGFT